MALNCIENFDFWALHDYEGVPVNVQTPESSIILFLLQFRLCIYFEICCSAGLFSLTFQLKYWKCHLFNIFPHMFAVSIYLYLLKKQILYCCLVSKLSVLSLPFTVLKLGYIFLCIVGSSSTDEFPKASEGKWAGNLQLSNYVNLHFPDRFPNKWDHSCSQWYEYSMVRISK
jgi:hypothetical protein